MEKTIIWSYYHTLLAMNERITSVTQKSQMQSGFNFHYNAWAVGVQTFQITLTDSSLVRYGYYSSNLPKWLCMTECDQILTEDLLKILWKRIKSFSSFVNTLGTLISFTKFNVFQNDHFRAITFKLMVGTWGHDPVELK